MNNVVLLSGGWESALCAAVACREAPIGRPIIPVFVDYGQSFLVQELRAARAVAHKLHLDDLIVVQENLDDANRHGRIIYGRNERFLMAALDRVPRVESLYFGSRNLLTIFDKYKDSNYQWGKQMGKKYHIDVQMPATLMPKWLVKRVVNVNGIPASMIFSSEGLVA